MEISRRDLIVLPGAALARSLWAADTGKPVRQIKGPPGHGGGTQLSVYCVTFSPDGKTLATGRRDEVRADRDDEPVPR